MPEAFMHPAVIRVREALDLHPGEPWTVADLAAIAGVSPSHLAERFQRDVGMPPHQYLIRRRLAMARELLQATDMPVTEIALELGFSSGQYFATTFRRLAGMSPAAFRRQARRDSVKSDE
jgi:AraC-like DNA-binding protein